jgi:2-keto-4-pentenoate hydratase/2-oxohepta-3-ene-1,7-dioic acid hydratase in catechol pathway
MKLCTAEFDGSKFAAILKGDKLLPVSDVNVKRGTRYSRDLLELISDPDSAALADLSKDLPATIPLLETRLCIPYERPGKVWCIGLNYKTHAEDLNAQQPDEPGSFMKPSSSFFEPGGEIVLPPERLTKDIDAEGELALVFGKRCKNVPIEEVPGVLFGYTTTLDMTALDILAKNTRYLQRSKSFDTFFTFGPIIVTKDEVPNIEDVEVITIHNGKEFSRDHVRNMRHLPFKLASFHSEVMTFEPGDILSTGCPKGARIKSGDTVEAHVTGIGRLNASVR